MTSEVAYIDAETAASILSAEDPRVFAQSGVNSGNLQALAQLSKLVNSADGWEAKLNKGFVEVRFVGNDYAQGCALLKEAIFARSTPAVA